MAEGDPRVRLIENPTNIGPAQANRQGVHLAGRHKLICLINSDVLVPHGWLGRLVAEFEQRHRVKLLAPLEFIIRRSAILSARRTTRPPGSGAAQQVQRASPLRQFHAYWAASASKNSTS